MTLAHSIEGGCRFWTYRSSLRGQGGGGTDDGDRAGMRSGILRKVARVFTAERSLAGKEKFARAPAPPGRWPNWPGGGKHHPMAGRSKGESLVPEIVHRHFPGRSGLGTVGKRSIVPGEMYKYAVINFV
jgi:hypothetical protein